MVTTALTRYLCLFMLSPLFLFSGEFSASVNRNPVGLGEVFTLNLILKDASPKSSPLIEPLKKTFLIHTQQQSSNTVITNGKVTSSISWKIILVAQQEGELIIPSFSIETSDGTLASEPIKVNVVKKAVSDGTDSANHDGVSLTVDVSNGKPYKNEPVFYTARLISRQNLANIQMQKLNVEDAIVENVGEPLVFDEVVDGMRVGVVEFNYLITPLKTGSLKIPSSNVQGGIPFRRNTLIRSLFDEAFDPFSFMQGFDSLKPFALVTEEVVLEVQPPVSEVNPWIPARSLAIKEIWDESQPLLAGEFFTRSFEIIAEGLHSSQLPSLEDQQISGNLFKVYGDKPELADEIKDGKVKSSRKESYTLIPQESGLLTLPEISVAWWDVVNKKKVLVRIPSRTLNVLPASNNELKSGLISIGDQKESLRELSVNNAYLMRPVFYVVIGVLIALLVAAIVWGILLQQKMKRLLAPSAAAQAAVKKVDIPRVNKKIPSQKVNRSPPNKQERLNDLNPT